MAAWHIEPFGDRAWLMKWEQDVDEQGGPVAWARAIAQRRIPWIVETVPGYDTLLIHIEALRVPRRLRDPDRGWDRQALCDALNRVGPRTGTAHALAEAVDCNHPSAEPNADGADRGGAVDDGLLAYGREIVVPVLYGGSAGPDLPFAASHSGLTERAFVDAHAGAQYRVAMIGFAPGFPYLTGLPDELALPRLPSPRRAVPAGSVGIAGAQTGVYPVDSPGGWRIIGRTPMRLFRPESATPFPIRPGDAIRFASISEREYARLSAAEERAEEGAEEGADEAGGGGTRQDSRPERGAAGAAPDSYACAGAPVLEVIEPGYYTTVQAGPRTGWQAYGVSAGGPMDRRAAREANQLVGGRGEEPLLELTIAGGRFRALRDCLVALTGADMQARSAGAAVPHGRPFLLAAGAELALGSAGTGCRAYLAIAGGIDVPEVLGSRSTDTRAGIGGLNGRALEPGAVLRGLPPSAAAASLLTDYGRQAAERGRQWHAGPARARAASALTPGGDGARTVALRVLLPTGGPEDDERQHPGYAALLGGPFETKAASDRMGIRLGGRRLPDAPDGAGMTVSHGVVPGTIQLPPGGEPIVLAAGCQPTGGYPVAGHVIAADLDLLGQLRPGDRVSFRPCGLPEALAEQARLARDGRIAEAGIRLAWYAGRRR